MQVPKYLDRALKSKNVMYTLLVVSILNVLNYLANNQYESTIFFCAVGFLVAFFNKNMTVVMAAAIVGTLLFRQSQYISREGMGNGNDGADHANGNGTNHDNSHDDGSENKNPCSDYDENKCPADKCSWDAGDGECKTKETFANRKSKGGSDASSDLAEAERLMTRLENMMQKAESFGGMFGGGKK